MTDKPTYSELEKSLKSAEEILETLRSHQVDAVVGTDDVALMRLRKVEDQLQEQIKVSSTRLKEIESIYQNVPVGLCILDRDLKFNRVNSHLVDINGIPAEDHLGKKIHEILPDLMGGTKEDLRQVIENDEKRLNVELSGETPAKAGVKRSFIEHWLPLHNKQGEVIGINMVIDEITDRKKYEKKLQELNATLESRVENRTRIAEQRADKLREMALQMTHVEEKERQRLARVLHDGLQQLLIGAKFNSKLIRDQLPDKEEVQEQLTELSQILDQSIEASRSLSYELSPPILHDHGLLAALEWLTETRHMKGLKIDIHAEKNVPELSQNLKVFLFQVVREFLVNVIKHAEVDQAEVRLASDDQNIIIEVIDKGVGFDTADLGSKDTTSSQGLRNIQEKLELMNGNLTIESEPGQGSHFKLEVPVNGNITSPKAVKDEKNEAVLTNKKVVNAQDTVINEVGDIKLLVVDDHQVMRSGLVRLLDREVDFNIIGEASNGVEAVDFVNEVQPDVIIMDITMPEMDGIEATRQIHQKFPEVSIVGLSMHEEGEYTTLMKKAGAKTLLNKGGPSDKLFAAIRNVEDE